MNLKKFGSRKRVHGPVAAPTAPTPSLPPPDFGRVQGRRILVLDRMGRKMWATALSRGDHRRGGHRPTAASSFSAGPILLIMTDLSILREITNRGCFLVFRPAITIMISKPHLCFQRPRRPMRRPFGISFPFFCFYFVDDQQTRIYRAVFSCGACSSTAFSLRPLRSLYYRLLIMTNSTSAHDVAFSQRPSKIDLLS